MIAVTPPPPYFAVIFTSLRTSGDNGYAGMSDEMVQSVQEQSGFLGFETARDEIGITVSYWKDMESIRNWKFHERHTEARNQGREKWYDMYTVRICKVEKEYHWKRS